MSENFSGFDVSSMPSWGEMFPSSYASTASYSPGSFNYSGDFSTDFPYTYNSGLDFGFDKSPIYESFKFDPSVGYSSGFNFSQPESSSSTPRMAGLFDPANLKAWGDAMGKFSVQAAPFFEMVGLKKPGLPNPYYSQMLDQEESAKRDDQLAKVLEEAIAKIRGEDTESVKEPPPSLQLPTLKSFLENLG